MQKQILFGVLGTLILGLSSCDGGQGSGGAGGTGAGGSGGNGGSETGGQTSTGGSASTTSETGGNGTGGVGAGTGGSGAIGGSGVGAGGTGGDDLAALSDEFNDSNTLSDWTLLHQVLGMPAPYDTLDIDTTVANRLVVVPTVSAWYQDLMATFLYKTITGDFLVEVDAAAYQKGSASAAPDQSYNSIGMLIRDPDSVPGEQNWLMYNIGYQESFIGVEGKATVSSESQLILIPTNGEHTAILRMCRIGNTVRMMRRLPGETDWTETHTFPSTFNQTAAYTLPQTVQVGIIDNAYVQAGLRGEVDYIHFHRLVSPQDCTNY